MDNNLIFDIADLYGEDIGKSRSFHLEVEQEFEPSDFNLKGGITADITFLRTDNSIAVLLEDMTYHLILSCSRCLKVFERKMRINRAEREFFFNVPPSEKTTPDIADTYTVDLKRKEIDLFEMFRQEILLHYDAFPVCSLSCKGICPTCGGDLNKAECGHDPIEKVETSREKEESVTPFKNLPKLF